MWFADDDALKEHLRVCSVPKKALMTIRGATMATKLIGECVTKVQWNTAESPALAPFAARVSAAVNNTCARKPVWAKRPGHGEGYGENTVGKYFSELMSYYMIGVLDKSRRMNAPIMLEKFAFAVSAKVRSSI